MLLKDSVNALGICSLSSFIGYYFAVLRRAAGGDCQKNLKDEHVASQLHLVASLCEMV